MSDETLPEQINRSTPISLEDIEKAAQQLAPVKQVEGEFYEFVKDSFDIVRTRDMRTQLALKALTDKLPDMDADQLIAAVSILTQNDNDLIGRILAPLSSLLTTSLHNEMEDRREREKMAVNIGSADNLSKKAAEGGNHVLVGADQLMKLTSLLETVNHQMPVEKSN